MENKILFSYHLEPFFTGDRITFPYYKSLMPETYMAFDGRIYTERNNIYPGYDISDLLGQNWRPLKVYE